MAATSEVTSCGPGRPPPTARGERTTSSQRGRSWPCRWMQLGTVWVALLLVLLTVGQLGSVHGEKTKTYYMELICKNHFLQLLYRKIDGATLLSRNERNLNCVVTFQTHSILQRFMLRFDMLQLDCNDHLYVYDGAHAVGTHKADLTCKDTKQSVGALLTKTNFLTFKYVTDNWGTETNGFKMVITSVKDSKLNCADFRCRLPDFCIHQDLRCDGINHCADGSDETVEANCPGPDRYINTIFGIELTWVILIGVSSLIVCGCIVGITICVYVRNARNTPNQLNSSIQLNQMIESNGSSKHLQGTLPRETTTLPASGNLHHPAGPLGYLRIPHKLMAKVRPIWCLAN
ncbi:uncharacterized protein LOC125769816 isoform X1 [Anopheles funestus]|uniref:uncharacterized protein LOC125769816 isoform X1 n=2 Tax=Anopheles funestus TaxID=62324 RepID=UPI0020C5BF97|nr:uncharacterized protein LOC125769816 isoform X1 [Anopheles funestus]XP_049294652.1 uncharacterized protein LOC125769816 isoform X1 [Anopheles funestus]XP_049294653.1 uncharacterized protein LOC125769816 isoform X1 [Anopheles funestus]